jgi:hypothetical protein
MHTLKRTYRYTTANVSELHGYACSCGTRDNGFLTRDYAIDGWREHAGLEPLTNHPQV